MKKTILILVFIIGAITTSNAQFDWGLKSGLNFASMGDFKSLKDDVSSVISDNQMGYNIGAFAEFGDSFYLRPELVYTHISSGYENIKSESSKIKMDKIDLPVLAGIKILGPLRVFAGPSLQYVINTKSDHPVKDVSISDIEKNFTIGGVIGLGVEFGKIGIDARYETGFSSNDLEFTHNDDIIGRVDARPKQIILGVSVKF